MSNRAAKYEQLHKSLKKHYKPLAEVGDRTVLDHLVYACCLEDAKSDQADEAFAKLQQAYFDWNEVRVTTVIELGEALGCLPNPAHAGHRIKRCLQSLFEARYNYDVEDLKKANLGKATEEITAWKGVTPFILNYICQNALGGHSIPADTSVLDALVAADILTEAEAEKKALPGVERAIPKNKGAEFASLLHQFGVDYHLSPKSANALAVFKDLGVTPKPKKVAPVPEAKEAKVANKPKPADGQGSPKKPDTKVVAPSVSPAGKTKDAPVAAKTKTPVDPKQSQKEESVKASPKKEAPKVVAEPKPVKAEPKVAPKAELKKADTKKLEVKKPAEKTTDKKSVSAKDSKSKPVAKGKETKAKPTDTKKVPTKSKPAGSSKRTPAKKSPSKSGSDKQATNVKMTKKKPR
jgi:endonuclease III